MLRQGIIERYGEYLPCVPEGAGIISLSEGSTPLLRAHNIESRIHPRIELWLKYEGLNPSGSFKDRGMTVAVTLAVREGHKAVMCASTGNTSASAAAYAARAGIECVVLIPKGRIAKGKLAQSMIHGARVLQIDGNFDMALELTRSITNNHAIALVNSINPHRLEGQKTGAFEIADDFGGVAPDFHVLPVGNAGNITAYWMGYKEYKEAGKSKNLPRMLGFQAAGAAPIVLGKPVDDPQTFATAIRIGNPASWQKALDARDESNGVIGMVTDRQIKRAYRTLAAAEGVFVEPASAAGIAGLFKLAQSGFFDNVEQFHGDKIRVVAVLTGHGLKDPGNAVEASEEAISVEATEDAILDAMQLYHPSET
ncbi:MAG: threonine synthase [Candidatus Hydrogenedentes bacterium]|nr:threonine synthase [Candidatus Hydrogenedentota bacterium]